MRVTSTVNNHTVLFNIQSMNVILCFKRENAKEKKVVESERFTSHG